MVRSSIALIGSGAAALLATLTATSGTPTAVRAGAATTYLAARAGSAPCLSCHTTFPYVLARKYLTNDSVQLTADKQVFDAISDRVKRWSEIQPYFTDKNSNASQLADARGGEAVLSATALVLRDKPSGQLASDTRSALDIVWSTQLKDGPNAGAWPWFRLGNEPWEADDSQYWGAGLIVLAVAESPSAYRNLGQIRAALASDESYLRSHLARQSLVNKAGALWVEGKSPFLTAAERQTIANEVAARQKPDGGWSVGSFAPEGCKRRDGTSFESVSDGYATGLAVLALQKQGGAYGKAVDAGRKWLITHQQADGSWKATSLNTTRDPNTDVGKFMTDAATAYAVLALGETASR